MGNSLVSTFFAGAQRKLPVGPSFMKKMMSVLGPCPLAKKGRNHTMGRGNNV